MEVDIQILRLTQRAPSIIMSRLIILLFLFVSPKFFLGQGSGNTLTFNGYNEAVDIGDKVANNCRTIEVWFKPYYDINSTLSDPISLIARDYDDGNPQSIDEFSICFKPIIWGNAGTIMFGRRVGGTPNRINSNSNSWTANHWYHVAVTIESTGGMKMYINGELQQSTNPSTTPIGTQSGNVTDKVSIGKWGNWGNYGQRYFNGEIDEVRIWECEKSEAEIREKMCVRLTGNEPQLRAYYRFDSQSGNILTDHSQNDFDGTLLYMSDENWTYSGAPIGDTSSYLYSNTSLTGQSLILNTGSGDSFLTDNINTTAKGIHIYKVNTLPNSLINLTNPVTGNYYGVYLSRISGTFDITYNYSDYDCSSCDYIFSRNGNDTLIWTHLYGISENCIFEINNQSTVGYNYRAEYIIDHNNVSVNVDLGNDTVICDFDNLVLNAGSGFEHYLWQDGSTDSTFLVTQSGTYWVLVTDTSGCSGGDTISIELIPFAPPDLGNDSTICEGSTLMLSPGPDYTSFLWQDGSSEPFFSVSQPGEYWVQVANDCGSGSDTITIAMIPGPTVSLGNDTSFCYGHYTTLNAGSGFASYFWNNGSTDSSITAYLTGNYWVIGNDY